MLDNTPARATASPGSTPRRTRLPSWMRAPMPTGPRTRQLKEQLAASKLHTVCQEALCPNLGECFEAGTATFMLLGDRCTRACTYCFVDTRKPLPPDPQEPERLADLVAEMALNHVVVTSVNRDDLPDGGAYQFVRVIEEIRRRDPNVRVEVLIPDFEGNADAQRAIVDAGPDILNHNLETVRRLYPEVRRQGRYDWAIQLLDRVKHWAPEMVTKSGVMVGLGETDDELYAAMEDLRVVGCDILTLGQYLQPSPRHRPVHRFVHPATFRQYQEAGIRMGYSHVESGPLVRSSYHAADHVTNIKKGPA